MEIRKIGKKEFFEDSELKSRIEAELDSMGVTENKEKHIDAILQKMGIVVVDEGLSEDEKNAEMVGKLLQDEETLEMVSGGTDDDDGQCKSLYFCNTIINQYNATNTQRRCYIDVVL